MMLNPTANPQPTAQLPQMDGVDLSFLPPGITPSDYANMPPEH